MAAPQRLYTSHRMLCSRSRRRLGNMLLHRALTELTAALHQDPQHTQCNHHTRSRVRNSMGLRCLSVMSGIPRPINPPFTRRPLKQHSKQRLEPQRAKIHFPYLLHQTTALPRISARIPPTTVALVRYTRRIPNLLHQKIPRNRILQRHRHRKRNPQDG